MESLKDLINPIIVIIITLIKWLIVVIANSPTLLEFWKYNTWFHFKKVNSQNLLSKIGVRLSKRI